MVLFPFRSRPAIGEGLPCQSGKDSGVSIRAGVLKSG